MLVWQTIIGGLLGGGLIGFIEFLIRRGDARNDKHDAVLAKLEQISSKITDIEERLDRENADDARRNILAFDDEIRRSVPHSEESFNQILEDINFYTNYCREHDDYKNAKAVNAIENINKVYQQVKYEDRFI